MTDLEAKNRRVAEWLGIPWHELVNHIPDGIIGDAGKCVCGKVHFVSSLKRLNPDFTSDAGKVELLRLMAARVDYHDFIEFMESRLYGDWVAELFNLFTDTTGLLLKAAVEWMEERK